MPDGAILDNDILIKVGCYSICDEVVAALAPIGTLSVLGVARFAAPKQAVRSRRISDAASAVLQVQRLLAFLATIEPTPEETQLAAAFEQHALEEGLPLDGGEGQILAIVASRAGSLMVTGDKRAVASVETILNLAGSRGACDGRIACLEQLMTSVLRFTGVEDLRQRVCREPSADTAISNAFSCYADSVAREEDVLAGLGSYVEHVRRSGPSVLRPGPDISIVP